MATTKLTAPNGASVTVSSDRVDNLLRRGFTTTEPKKSPKKATSSKAEKK